MRFRFDPARFCGLDLLSDIIFTMIYLIISSDIQLVLNWLRELKGEIIEINAQDDEWLAKLGFERNEYLFAGEKPILFIKDISGSFFEQLKQFAWLKKREVVFWTRKKPLVKEAAALEAVFRGVKIKEKELVYGAEDSEEYAREIGLHISPQTLRQLAEVFVDAHALRLELRKLKDFFGENRVDPELLPALLQRPLQVDEKLVSLVGALSERNKIKAYQALRKERLLGTEPVKIMGFVNFAVNGRGGFSPRERERIAAGLSQLDRKYKKGLVERESFFDELFGVIFG